VVDDPGVEPSDGKDETDEEAAGALADPGIGLSGKFGGKMSGGGLRPPGESSVAPNGRPTRPTGCGRPCASGDEADAPSRVGVAAGGAHASNALPVLLPLPALPPPSKSALAAPTVEHAVLLLFDGGGLRPGVASSSAPIGTPTGGTADPGPIPSGDVMPSGEAVGPTWANAAPQPRTSRKAAGIVVLISIDLLIVLLRRDRPDRARISRHSSVIDRWSKPGCFAKRCCE
jgi:hypothetical protein